ncbi:MAG: hypothetical protein AAB468_00320 [Patescibacteria group bacterium]
MCITDETLDKLGELNEEDRRLVEDMIQNCVFCKRIWLFHGSRETKKPEFPPVDDSFMQKAEELFRGEGEGAEKLLEEVARRLFKINMINRPLVQRVIGEVYGSVPTPLDFSERLMEKLQKLRKQ